MRKLNWRGEFRYAWPARLLRRDACSLVLDARWEGPGEPVVGDMRFVLGDRFLEYYYPGRGYAIWQVEQPDGAIKGWYCNISTPVGEDQGTLTFRDLLLDVVAYPDGRYTVLDRDEFETARAQGLPTEEASAAEDALASVITLIENVAHPFAFSQPPSPIGAA